MASTETPPPSPPPPPPPVGEARPAYRDANVLRWLAAYTASLVGDSVYFVALAWSAQKVAGPTEIGLVMAMGALPRAVLMLGGGVVADRFGPRRVVLGSDTVRCLLILTVAAAIALSGPALWLLIATALVFSTVDAVFMPAVGALPPRITDADQLARVTGMRSLSIRLSQIAGPPIGGLAMGLGGAAAAFAVAGVLFAVSLPLLLAVRLRPLEPRDGQPRDGQPRDGQPRDGQPRDGQPRDGQPRDEQPCDEGQRGEGQQVEGRHVEEQPQAPAGSAWQDIVDGLRHIRRHPLLFPLVLVGAISELALTGTLNVGMVLLNDERGWGPSGYGFIISAFGAGAAASAALLTFVGWLPRGGLTMSATLLASCAGAASLALVPGLWAAVAVAAVTGLSAGVFGSLNNTLVQTETDPAYLGRVTSVVMLTAVGVAPLTYPLVGAAIGAWGATSVFVGSGAFAAVAVVVALASDAVRRAELPRKSKAQA
ncbi:MFS transporter [Streptomyces sp. NPDC088789]|uniref:MFS transporter n=1 Tax=Streptomyces sp. NPDC088789 TaxID=3365899 RepID=UPI0037F866E8